MIAYRDDAPAGWLQIGPRAHVPEWNRPRRVMSPTPDAPADDAGVWAATCFFVGRGHRGCGVTSVLLKAGIDFAKKSGARAIDACPFDAAKSKSSPALSAGSSAVFAKAGFVEVARRREGRPLMRLTLAWR